MMGGEQSHTRKDGEGAEGAGKAEESTNTDSPGSAASEGWYWTPSYIEALILRVRKQQNLQQGQIIYLSIHLSIHPVILLDVVEDLVNLSTLTILFKQLAVILSVNIVVV